MNCKTLKFQQGFSLIEIMIALAILSISLVSLYSGVASSIRSSREANKVRIATQLSRQKMTEIMLSLEEEIARGAFPDEKEESGEFEKPFESYRWFYEIKKVEIPVVSPTGEMVEDAFKNSSGDPNQNKDPTAFEQIAAGQISQAVSKKLSESLRELNLKVSWGEAQVNEEHINLSTHLVKMK